MSHSAGCRRRVGGEQRERFEVERRAHRLGSPGREVPLRDRDPRCDQTANDLEVERCEAERTDGDLQRVTASRRPGQSGPAGDGGLDEIETPIRQA